jgi:hypothetical protein
MANDDGALESRHDRRGVSAQPPAPGFFPVSIATPSCATSTLAPIA